MSARDIIHNMVKNALLKDGWIITEDPYTLAFEEVTLYADLGAERPIAAERGGQKIVVEIKSFVSVSLMQDLKEAVGQYLIYRGYLEESEPERKLYLALGEKIYLEFFQMRAVQFVVQKYQLSMIVVNLDKEEITTWVN